MKNFVALSFFALLNISAHAANPANIDASSLPPSWEHVIGGELQADYYVKLQEFIKKERKTKHVFPAEDEVFTAFHLTPFDDVKVVIIGQDPYPSAGMAHGLAFSVKPDVTKIPASLKNIFKELHADLPELGTPKNGYLGPWAQQGVLMINTVMTVVEGQPNSHANKGWETFTDAAIKALVTQSHHKIVFVLWGNYAQKKAKMIEEAHQGHLILKGAHPSPLSVKKFLGSRPFSKVNNLLEQAGEKPIDWDLSADRDAANNSIQRAVASEPEKEWYLGGYLPSDPDKKTYLRIRGRKIIEVNSTPPQGSVVSIDTDSFLFPGLIDMHNHMESNYLGLWKNAKGQYLNRFEWRTKKEYDLAVKNNDAAFDGSNEGTCAAFRWAEIKALVGGVTSIQGMGSRAKCVSDFGINNVEVTGEFGNKAEIRANLELVNARNVGHVFIPKIEPLMKKGMTYDQAFDKMLENEGVKAWVANFKKLPRNLQSGLTLTIGDTLKASATADPDAELTRLQPDITKFITDPKGKIKMSAVAAKSYLTALHVFLLGDDKNEAYISKSAPAATDDEAYDFLGKAANVQVSGGIKRYVTMFEFGLKRGALNALKTGKASAYITHLAEGMRNDAYNKQEYTLAREMGLAVKGMVYIHGVGMQPADFKHAAQNNISVVWSPFSNLLLYGETLDVVTARKAGVRLALGSDWSPSGSKSLVDELKIARRYLDGLAKDNPSQASDIKQITDQELVDMATIHAAEALGVSQLVGKVEVGYQADLALVSRKALARTGGKSPYTAMVQADRGDMTLVVVKGQPLYGDKDLIAQFNDETHDGSKTESLPSSKRFSNSTCKFEKSIRFPFTSKLDQELGAQRNLRSVGEIEKLLVGLLDANGKKIKARGKADEIANIADLDSIYPCEDPSSQYGTRFANFVETEVPQDRKSRPGLRGQQNLLDTFNPLSVDDDGPDL